MDNFYIKTKYSEFYSQFEKYCSLLIEWNEKMNLTSITEHDDVFNKHFVDSLIGEEFIKKDATIIDIGTGAGFPSLPIKIVRKDVNLTLNDCLNKRLIFLNEVIKELNLEKVKTLHSRAEDLPKNVKYDYALSRAVASLNTLSEYCLPFVKVGGYFIAYKSKDIDEELKNSEKAIEILGGKIEEIKEISIPDTDIVRKLVFIKKIKETPQKYPRGKNLPKTKPL
jgi:16S rRNA (guanine527-N7)-methyltransferase